MHHTLLSRQSFITLCHYVRSYPKRRINLSLHSQPLFYVKRLVTLRSCWSVSSMMTWRWTNETVLAYLSSILVSNAFVLLTRMQLLRVYLWGNLDWLKYCLKSFHASHCWLQQAHLAYFACYFWSHSQSGYVWLFFELFVSPFVNWAIVPVRVTKKG